MKDTTEHYAAFLSELARMADFFSDALSAERLDLYWELVAPRVSLAEWSYACKQAMLRESFHKVPLPDVLLSYVKEQRIQQADDERSRARWQEIEARAQPVLTRPTITEAERKAQTTALLERLETMGSRKEHLRLHEKDPAYWQPLEASEIADRKARLIRQAQQIMEEESCGVTKA